MSMAGVVCQASGIVASMAVSVFESCSHRVMLDNSVLMVHSASMGTQGNDTELSNAAESLRVLNLAMAQGLAKHSKVSAAFILSQISGNREWWINSDQALALGLTDEVK